jgi:hypothetical protein
LRGFGHGLIGKPPDFSHKVLPGSCLIVVVHDRILVYPRE